MTKTMSSSKSRKKGKVPAKATLAFVESSVQMTKSRNTAEENILRHRLKDLEDQRRRSILAYKEEEKLLIRDLETHRRASLTDSDKVSARKEQLELKYASHSRRGSPRSSDDNDNTLTATTDGSRVRNNNNNSNNKSMKLNINNNDMDNSDNRDSESRKHLWRNRKSALMSTKVDGRLLKGTSSKVCPKRIQSQDERLHISDFVKDLSTKTKNSSSCDNAIPSTSRISGPSSRSDIVSKASERSLTPLSRSVLSRTKSIEINSLEESSDHENRQGLSPNKKTAHREDNKPMRTRRKLEERRDRSMMSLAKRAGSLKWSSFEDLDNQLNWAYGLIDKHAKRLSRSVNIKIEDDVNENKTTLSHTPAFTSRSYVDDSSQDSTLTRNVRKLSKSLQNVNLSSLDNKQSPLQTESASRIRPTLSNRSSQHFDDVLHQNPLDKITPIGNQPSTKCRNVKENSQENTHFENELTSSLPTPTELKSSADTVKRNSIGRNKIILSPIASRTKSQTSGCVPTCAEKIAVKKPSKKRRNVTDKIELQKLNPVNHITSDSDSGGSNVSRRGSIPDSDRKPSIPMTLPVRPVSSWSQRKRSIVFGEKSPQTPREVLNDTHAQWEELGDFLGQIRKQHNMDHARLSSAKHNSSPIRPTDQSRRNSNFATVVEQRLLPRRHSESNIILLSHATQGKRNVLDMRQQGGATPSHSRRKSCLPPEHSGATQSTTHVKKLVAIHNALQSSALSMADMDSEMF